MIDADEQSEDENIEEVNATEDIDKILMPPTDFNH
jgi:hypothetical protein